MEEQAVPWIGREHRGEGAGADRSQLDLEGDTKERGPIFRIQVKIFLPLFHDHYSNIHLYIVFIIHK